MIRARGLCKLSGRTAPTLTLLWEDQILGPPTAQQSIFLRGRSHLIHPHTSKQFNQIECQILGFHELMNASIRRSVDNNIVSGSLHCGCRNYLQQVESPFCVQLGTGFTASKVTQRGLATQSDFGSEDDIETDFGLSLSESDEVDNHSSDKDIIDKELNRNKNPSRTSVRTGANYDAEEDMVDFDAVSGDSLDDELKVSSLLDTASGNPAKETGRPLWMRLEEAYGNKSSTLRDVLDTWTAEGNSICRAVIVFTITVLRRRRRYWRALEVSDWVLTQKPFELTDMDYAIRVELIGKVQGAQKAAYYFATIPKQFQTAMAYSILLTTYVEQNKEKEAINLVQKIERLDLDHKTYMYNQMLYLYKKNGLMSGVAEVLQTMDEKNIEPDVHTYNIILDIRARKGDASGMEKVWSRMKEDKDVEPDAVTFAILAKGYLNAGWDDKAEKAAKKVEGSRFRRQRVVNLLLLKLYGQLRKEDELERVWGLVTQGSKVGTADYIAMIRALAKVGNADRAEDIFEEMVEKIDNLTVHHYNAFLSVYANLGRVHKGENVLKQMARAHLNPNSGTYHELVLMYLKASQEQKAMEVLMKVQKAGRASIRNRPMYVTFQLVLQWFADKGDVKNSEKVIKDLKESGYSCAYRSYILLLKAYENGRMSPYGFLDRLRADNIIPNQLIRKELRKLEGT